MDLTLLSDTVVRGDPKTCARLTQEGLDAGLSAQALLHEGLMPGLAVIGDRFKANEVCVPEVLTAARAMKAGMAILHPRLAVTGAKPVGKVVAGTVAGDLHDIGKNIVCMLLEGSGFQVVDLGNDVSPERFVRAIQEQDPQIIGLSTLLTTTMLNLRKTIEALRAAGLREQVKVMVGGAPVTQQFADEIGADGFAEDAASAVEKAKALLAVR